MKRIHLFEFEDIASLPDWLRDCMTQFVVVMHRVMGSTKVLAPLLARVMRQVDDRRVIDLCSGSGGPMLEVVRRLRLEPGLQNLKLTLTDLFPNLSAASLINHDGDGSVRYETTPVNAAELGPEHRGTRTMICSLHHMRPEVARSILKNARDSRQPFCVFELSNNPMPRGLWWLGIPFGVLVVLLVSWKVRPFTFRQFIFTYVIPLLPFLIAWDGAISNARTYTLEDLDELLDGLESDSYQWEKASVRSPHIPVRMLYLLGLPVKQTESAPISAGNAR